MSDDLDNEWEKDGGGRKTLPLLALACLIATPFGLEAFRPGVIPEGMAPSVLVANGMEGVRTALSGEPAEQAAEISAGDVHPDEAVAEPVTELADGLSELRRKYGSILPEQIAIPSTLPDLSRIVTIGDTLGQMAGGDELPPDSPVLRYALGEEGVSPEIAEAFEIANRPEEPEENPAPKVSDEEMSRRALAEIGYVPAGIDPADVRALDDPLEGPGRQVVSGHGSVISGHQILVGDSMIRLQGVRAPALADICTGPGGDAYDCMAWAREGMTHVLGEHLLDCAVTEDEHEEGGRIGWCNLTIAEQSHDLGKVAVGAGILLAVPGKHGVSLYEADMLAAQQKRLGLWAGEFLPDGLQPAAVEPAVTVTILPPVEDDGEEASLIEEGNPAVEEGMPVVDLEPYVGDPDDGAEKRDTDDTLSSENPAKDLKTDDQHAVSGENEKNEEAAAGSQKTEETKK